MKPDFIVSNSLPFNWTNIIGVYNYPSLNEYETRAFSAKHVDTLPGLKHLVAVFRIKAK